jgi:hypothetical protein
MNDNYYSRSILLRSSAEAVFNAITQRIPDWWSREFTGSASKADDEFTVRFGPTFKTMKISKASEPTDVTWLCIAQQIVMPDGLTPLKNPSEWVGNTISWHIAREADECRLTLTHIGLTPESECWVVCEPGWDQTMKSLEKFLLDGCGQPFQALDEEHLAQALSKQSADKQNG